MAETLTPISTTINGQKPSLSSRVLSPTPLTPFCMDSNDDRLERAAARAAYTRRKGVVLVPHSKSSLSSHSCLNRDQIIDLFRNCVRLACENKINEKNTWELKLIDYLSEIINVEALDNSQTNFQKACSTLEAGVKIYVVRVDAWHADAYRVLGRISRAAIEDEKEKSVGEVATSSEKSIVKPKMETDKKLSPLSTVESSFEAFNAKKFDAVFSVDPLYHQTSLQFNEGGAKGLLLYNLGVYGVCRVLFDSLEKPTKYTSCGNDSTKSDLIDISFAREYIEELVTNIHKEQLLCPTLTDITNQRNEFSFPSFDDRNSADRNVEFGVSEDSFSITNANKDPSLQINGGLSDSVLENNCDEEQVPFTCYEHANDGKVYNVSSLLLQPLQSSSIHWKYKNPKGLRSVSTTHDGGWDSVIARSKSLKTTELDIDFSSLVDVEMCDVFLPSKHPESLLLVQTKNSTSRTFPDGCRYQLEDLLKLFLLPNIKCLGPKRRIVSGTDAIQSTNGGGKTLPSSSDQDSMDGYDDDRCIQSDVEHDVIVSQPRQVNKIEVQYNKDSKHVDIQMLKETIWNHMQGSIQKPVMVKYENVVSFRNVLATVPYDSQASPFHNISPHLCFVCILHLANEHGLTIEGFPNMEDLSIHIPVASQGIIH